MLTAFFLLANLKAGKQSVTEYVLEYLLFVLASLPPPGFMI